MCESSSVNIRQKQSKDKESELMWDLAQPFTAGMGALSSLLSLGHNWSVRTLLSEYSDESSAGVFEPCLHFYHDARTDLSESSDK